MALTLLLFFYIFYSYDWYQNDKIVTISVYTKKKVGYNFLTLKIVTVSFAIILFFAVY